MVSSRSGRGRELALRATLGGDPVAQARKRESVASEDELRQIGGEVASAMVKGLHEGLPKRPGQVPMVPLMFVCGNHNLAALSTRDFGIVAAAMEAALKEAERWSTCEAPPTSGGD